MAADTGSKELMQSLVQIRRTSLMRKGGRAMSISACVVVGDGKGRIGFGAGEDKEVPNAVQKAITDAKQRMVSIQLNNGTLYHDIVSWYGATKVIMKPASEGTGIIAGGAMRAVCEVMGVKNILAKIYGSTNPINVVRATINGLMAMSTPESIADKRGIDVARLLPPKKEKGVEIVS